MQENKFLPTVSIVIPTFNRKELLHETINSILNQTFTDFEIIIVDNMSTDGTKEYTDSIGDNRIRYFRNSNDGIIATNRNYGISKSKGKYIAFCDDDDLWDKDKLKHQLNTLTSDASCALCYTNALSFRGCKIITQMMIKRRYFNKHGYHLLRGNLIPCSSVVVKKEILLNMGGFDQARNIIGAEDYELWLRISSKYTLAYIDLPLIKYRIHSNFSSSLSNQARLNMVALKLAKTKGALPYNFFLIPYAFQMVRRIAYWLIAK